MSSRLFHCLICTVCETTPHIFSHTLVCGLWSRCGMLTLSQVRCDHDHGHTDSSLNPSSTIGHHTHILTLTFMFASKYQWHHHYNSTCILEYDAKMNLQLYRFQSPQFNSNNLWNIWWTPEYDCVSLNCLIVAFILLHCYWHWDDS